MATHLVEIVQQNLGYPPLEKVDPVNHEPKSQPARGTEQALAQAAIPTVLVALFKLSQSEGGSHLILSGNEGKYWLSTLFGKKEHVAVDKVAQYAGFDAPEVAAPMERIAAEAVLAINKVIGDKKDEAAVKTFMGNHRHEILVYLPASMQMGVLLNDNTLDDRTNKMEGPISNFMHTIENKMSGKDT